MGTVGQGILDNWVRFNTAGFTAPDGSKSPNEGLGYGLYPDIKGLMTSGMGNLMEPVSVAQAAPFKKGAPIGGPATEDMPAASAQEIADEWSRIRAMSPVALATGKPAASDLAAAGGLSARAKGVTTLNLTPAGVQGIIANKLASNDTILRRNYPAYDSWPLDAQIALHSMAWAMGPAFNFPSFKAASQGAIPNFAAMADQCFINTYGPDGVTKVPNAGLVPRNVANKKLLMNAHNLMHTPGADITKLYYPNDVPAPGTGALPPATGGGYVPPPAAPPAAPASVADNSGTIEFPDLAGKAAGSGLTFKKVAVVGGLSIAAALAVHHFSK
jgi:hypothetical protein